MITLSASVVRAAQQCQASKDIRHFLNGILFAANGDVVATDGHILFKCPDAFDVPDGFTDTIINVDGSIPAGADTVTIYLDSGMAKTDNKKAFTIEIIDGKYPDYQRVIPPLPFDCASNVKGFDPVYLAKLAKVYPESTVAMHSGNHVDSVVFTPYGSVPDVLIDSLVVLMPCSLDKDQDVETFYPQKIS